MNLNDFKFNNFTLQNEILGTGAFSVVYKGKNNKTQEEVAIKIIKNRTKYLENEIAIMKKLSHINIVKCIEIINSNSNIAIVMELFGNETLDLYIKRCGGKIELKEVQEISKQISSGLEYIHLQHIIHRDIKTENILYKEGKIKITDFGLSVENEMNKTFCGTRYYMAPEIYQKNEYNYKVDIWAFGIIIYRMIKGKYLFDKVPTDFTKELFIKDSELLIKNYEEIGEILEGMLKKNPEERFGWEEIKKYEFFNKKEKKLKTIFKKKEKKKSVVEIWAEYEKNNKLKYNILELYNKEKNYTELNYSWNLFLPELKKKMVWYKLSHQIQKFNEYKKMIDIIKEELKF